MTCDGLVSFAIARRWYAPVPILAVLLLGCATTSVPPTAASPEEAVQRFCRLDYEGVRLSSDTDHLVRPLVAWPRTPDTDPVYVVSGYEIEEAVVSEGRAQVTVRYDVVTVIGVPWKPAESPQEGVETPADGVRRVTFTLEARAGAWRIVSPAITPHSSREALARVVRSWPQAGVRNNDSRINATLDRLEGLR